jgi:hypothetical protein
MVGGSDGHAMKAVLFVLVILWAPSSGQIVAAIAASMTIVFK